MLRAMRRAHASAVVVAAGAGSRLGGGEPKALLTIGGRMMVAVAAGAIVACDAVDDVVVVAPPGYEDTVKAALVTLDPEISVVPGGTTRQASVGAGLAAVDAEAKIVVVHDAARPFASAALFTSVIQAVAAGADAAVPVLPLTDTVKRVRDGLVVDTEPREELALAQTPQAARVEPLRSALERAAAAGLEFTDDAALLEWTGRTVRVVPGEAGNFKITTLLDLLRADELLGPGRG
jgi:2-C-methyl-D-erythritol 4-phosphate cytidylyltransferase